MKTEPNPANTVAHLDTKPGAALAQLPINQQQMSLLLTTVHVEEYSDI